MISMIRNQGDEDGSESPTKQPHGGSPVKTVMSKFQRQPRGGNQLKGGKQASMKVFHTKYCKWYFCCNQDLFMKHKKSCNLNF